MEAPKSPRRQRSANKKIVESCSIYLLRCTDNKYYVGRSNDPERRYQEHLSGQGGSEWTRVYKPISMKILKRKASVFDEDMYVKEMMCKKGIDNVRGGSYSAFTLSRATLNNLYRELKNATDRCFQCGEPGHFSGECTSEAVTVYSDPDVTSKPLTVRKCSACGKPGHNKRSCGRNKL